MPAECALQLVDRKVSPRRHPRPRRDAARSGDGSVWGHPGRWPLQSLREEGSSMVRGRAGEQARTGDGDAGEGTDVDHGAITEMRRPGTERRHDPSRTGSRLVAELNRRASEDLDYLTELEELNRTIVVNRAIQIYAMLRRCHGESGAGMVSIDW